MGSKQRRQLARARNRIADLQRAGEALLLRYEGLYEERRPAVVDGTLEEPHTIFVTIRVPRETFPRGVSVHSLEPLAAACVRRSIEELQRRAGKAQEPPP